MTPDLRVARKNLGLSEGEEGKVKATLFPIVAGSYEEREHSIYGISEVEGLIPNQKAMNLTMAMQILSTQRLAWGKYIVKKDALKNQDITDEPGQVLVDYSAEGEGIKRLHEPGFSSMPLQIVNTLDIGRGHALLFHFFAIVGNVVPYVLYLLDQSFRLPCTNLLMRSSFDLLLIIAFHNFFSF